MKYVQDITLKRLPLGQMLIQRAVLILSELEKVLKQQKDTKNRLVTECYVQGLAAEQELLPILEKSLWETINRVLAQEKAY